MKKDLFTELSGGSTTSDCTFSLLTVNTFSYFSCFYCRWLDVRLVTCAALPLFFIAFLTILSGGDWGEGRAGLCLSYALSIGTNLNSLIRYTGDVQVRLVSVERVINFIHSLRKEVNIDIIRS